MVLITYMDPDILSRRTLDVRPGLVSAVRCIPCTEARHLSWLSYSSSPLLCVAFDTPAKVKGLGDTEEQTPRNTLHHS